MFKVFPFFEEIVKNFQNAIDDKKNLDRQRRIDTLIRNMLLLKNPQFLPNNYGTLSKWPTHE